MVSLPENAKSARYLRVNCSGLLGDYSSNSLRGTPDCRMMERSVPFFNSLWSGTGTVVVPPSSFARCITMWLPRRRTSAKPCRSSMAQTSLPDKTRSLPKGNLKLGDEHLTVLARRDFGGRSTFVEQLDCLA